MQVGHRFTALRTVIDDEPEAFRPQLVAELPGYRHEVPQCKAVFRRCFANTGDTLFRYNEQMHWCLRLNIADGHTNVIFMLNGGRYFTINNLFKKGFFRHDVQ